MNRRQLLVGGGAVALGGAGVVGAAVAATRAILSHTPSIPDLLRYATLAADGHNSQPWKFVA